MVEHNMMLIIMVVVAIILLFAAMVLSAMSSSAAKKESSKGTAHKYSMYAAVVCGIAVLLLGIALVIYLNREEAYSSIQKTVHKWIPPPTQAEQIEMASASRPQNCHQHFMVECDDQGRYKGLRPSSSPTPMNRSFGNMSDRSNVTYDLNESDGYMNRHNAAARALNPPY